MLHWLAGAKAPDGSNDADAAGYTEPPETPAPIFAVRAFKHAIFGTPQTAQPKPRRHSNSENVRHRASDPRPARPRMARPKSTSDAQASIRTHDRATLEVPNSPTKGILLTPGTGGAKRKNVTFGDHVADSQEMGSKSGMPDTCPGKFPSPWARSTEPALETDQHVEKKRARGRLTEALEQAREEAAAQKSKAEDNGKNLGNAEEGDDGVARPQSESGTYWKREYDMYRENTQREVKKLIAKRKLAKEFAKSKDDECTELAERLKREQRRVESLEAKTNDLSKQVKDLETLLRASQQAAQDYQDELAALKEQHDRTDRSRPHTSDGTKSRDGPRDGQYRYTKDTDAYTLSNRAQRTATMTRPEEVQRPSEPALDNERVRGGTTLADLPSTWKRKSQTIDARIRSKPEYHAKDPDALDAVPSISAEVLPLKTISVNTISVHPQPNQDAHLLPPEPGRLRQNMDKGSNAWQGAGKDTWLDAPLLAPSLLTMSEEPDVPAHSSTRPSLSPRRKDYLASATEKPSEATARSGQSRRRLGSVVSVQNDGDAAAAKPSAVWTSINTAQGKRATNLIGKDGKEVGVDRLEAARARIAARGRVVS